MSLKPIWKERAIARATEPKSEFGPSPLEGFRRLSFEEIREKMIEAARERMPAFAPSLDDPTSNIMMLIDAVAAADAEAYAQIEAMASFLESKGVTTK